MMETMSEQDNREDSCVLVRPYGKNTSMTPKDCIDWADKIDNRLGPISGADADRLAKFLHQIGGEIERWQVDRRELAFWRYQAVWARTYMLLPSKVQRPWVETCDLEASPEWKEAERQLEANRAAENRERNAHAEPDRDPGGT